MSILSDVKIMLAKGTKGDAPEITETPIENGHRVTFSYPDGDGVSFDVHNATSGDYEGLTNKPSINGNTIYGDMSFSDLGIKTASASQTTSVSISPYDFANINVPVPEIPSVSSVIAVTLFKVTTEDDYGVGVMSIYPQSGATTNVNIVMRIGNGSGQTVRVTSVEVTVLYIG